MLQRLLRMVLVIPEWLAPKAGVNAIVNGTSNPRVVGSKGCCECSKGEST
jgi:hypothetical protein